MTTFKSLMPLFFSLLCLLPLAAQNVQHPDEILRKGDKVPQVLLLGSFHFSYPNLDAHKTDKENQVNVKSTKKQKEMLELLDYIARFKPTKIIVERHKGSSINEQYQKYRNDQFNLPKSEVYQIGFRLAKRFNIPEIIPGDASTLSRDLYYGSDSTCMRPILDKMYDGWDFRSDDLISKRYGELYDYGDNLKKQLTLLELFKYLNSDILIKRYAGAYFSGDFELGEYRGADALALMWYSRNFRIFRNIQSAATSPDDRILVIFGAGHLGILKHQLECSPALQIVNFSDLKKS